MQVEVPARTQQLKNIFPITCKLTAQNRHKTVISHRTSPFLLNLPWLHLYPYHQIGDILITVAPLQSNQVHYAYYSILCILCRIFLLFRYPSISLQFIDQFSVREIHKTERPVDISSQGGTSGVKYKQKEEIERGGRDCDGISKQNTVFEIMEYVGNRQILKQQQMKRRSNFLISLFLCLFCIFQLGKAEDGGDAAPAAPAAAPAAAAPAAPAAAPGGMFGMSPQMMSMMGMLAMPVMGMVTPMISMSMMSGQQAKAQTAMLKAEEKMRLDRKKMQKQEAEKQKKEEISNKRRKQRVAMGLAQYTSFELRQKQIQRMSSGRKLRNSLNMALGLKEVQTRSKEQKRIYEQAKELAEINRPRLEAQQKIEAMNKEKLRKKIERQAAEETQRALAQAKIDAEMESRMEKRRALEAADKAILDQENEEKRKKKMELEDAKYFAKREKMQAKREAAKAAQAKESQGTKKNKKNKKKGLEAESYSSSNSDSSGEDQNRRHNHHHFGHLSAASSIDPLEEHHVPPPRPPKPPGGAALKAPTKKEAPSKASSYQYYSSQVSKQNKHPGKPTPIKNAPVAGKKTTLKGPPVKRALKPKGKKSISDSYSSYSSEYQKNRKKPTGKMPPKREKRSNSVETHRKNNMNQKKPPLNSNVHAAGVQNSKRPAANAAKRQPLQPNTRGPHPYNTNVRHSKGQIPHQNPKHPHQNPQGHPYPTPPPPAANYNPAIYAPPPAYPPSAYPPGAYPPAAYPPGYPPANSYPPYAAPIPSGAPQQRGLR